VRTAVLATAGWIVAVAAATAAAWSAVSVVRIAVTPTPPAVQSAIDGNAADVPATGLPTTSAPTGQRAAADPTVGPRRSTSTSAQASSSGRTSRDAAGGAVLASGVGGSAVLRCAGTVPVFVNVAPRQGYTPKVDDSASGEVRFESATHRTDITATCSGNSPHWTARERDGGDGGGDNSGKGGGGSGSG
jgi:hypothetical protein